MKHMERSYKIPKKKFCRFGNRIKEQKKEERKTVQK
jgi:hypothetical protein